VLNWLNTVFQFIRDNDIHSENIYNMDESGFSIGSIQAARVIVDSSVSSQFQAQSGRQE